MSKRTKIYRPRRKVRHSVANPTPPKAEVRREIEALNFRGPGDAMSDRKESAPPPAPPPPAMRNLRKLAAQTGQAGVGIAGATKPVFSTKVQSQLGVSRLAWLAREHDLSDPAEGAQRRAASNRRACEGAAARADEAWEAGPMPAPRIRQATGSFDFCRCNVAGHRI